MPFKVTAQGVFQKLYHRGLPRFARNDVYEEKDRDDVRARDDVYEKNKIGMTCPGDANMMYQEKILLNFFKKLLFFNKSLISLHIEKQ